MNFDDAIALAKSRSDCEPKNIDTLVRVVRELAALPGSIIECGSYRCGATIAMAAADPLRNVFAFDTFGGLPYGEGVGFENFANTSFAEILEVTSQFPRLILVQGRHEDTVPVFPATPICLLFMDSDHYSSHQVCLKHFWPQLCSGGYVIFHDWVFDGVQRAVNEVIPRNEIRTSGRFEDSPNMGFIIKA